MKVILLVLFSIFSIARGDSIYAQINRFGQPNATSPGENKTKVIASIDTSRLTDIGYSDKFDMLPKLVFDSISETEFGTLQEQTFISKIKTEQKEGNFFIKTNAAKHKFEQYRDYGGNKSWNGYELLGYYTKLKLFAINQQTTSEGIAFGQLFLLDSVTDQAYNIVSFGDGSVALPIPSPGNKYLVYYYNAVYQHKNADIGILKINNRAYPKTFLKEYASFNSTSFAIEQIVWKSDNCFYVKGYEEVYIKDKWIKQYKYYQTTFK